MKFRLKPNTTINDKSAWWIVEGEEYEGLWSQEFPPRDPPDVWLYHPENPELRYKIPSTVLERTE